MNEIPNSNFWLFLEILAKRRKFIFSFVILFTSVITLVAFLLPKWYNSSALLMPPEERVQPLVSLAGAIDGGLGGFELQSISTSADVFVRILKSRTVVDRVIDRFDLMKRYGKDNYIDTYEELMDRSKMSKTTEGLLFVAVDDYEAQMAADLTNAFVEELDRVSREVAARKARQKREFLENRLRSITEEVIQYRNQLEKFQTEHHALNFDEQTRLVMEQAVELKIDLARVDIDLKMLESSTVGRAADVNNLSVRKKLILEKLNQLERGSDGDSYFSIPLSSLPSLQNKYGVLYTKVSVGEDVVNVVTQQLEQARTQEKATIAAFSVIQYAIVPEIPYRPRKGTIILSSFALSILLASILAALANYLEMLKGRNPEDYRRAHLFYKAYLGWLPQGKKES